MAARLPREVREGLGRIPARVAPVPVVVVLDVLARDEALHAAHGPVGPVDELQHVGRQELHGLGHPAPVELLGEPPGLGLHFDVLEVLRHGRALHLGHLDDELGLVPARGEVAHVKGRAHRSLREGLLVYHYVDHGPPPLLRLWVVLVFDGALGFRDVKVVAVYVFWKLELGTWEPISVGSKLVEGTAYSNLTQRNKPGSQHKLWASQMTLFTPVTQGPNFSKSGFWQSRS
mmetsp:Transcript_77271/g.208579  ORF Transcript_77271/g.208579 Transcript_77271/m.208579 type:complete len:231 (-) Transcript_77271:330-1022(-)